MSYWNSKMSLGKVYFWTDTIKDWKEILEYLAYKQLIINVLKQLVDKKLINVYGFVIMPNHLHLIWRMNSKNGREMPYASFNKAIGHLIIKNMKESHDPKLTYFKVDEPERQYRVWQRDPLAVLLDSKAKLEQKLDYIHLNPLQEKWNLVAKPEDYRWSSAGFYETGKDEFEILTHYMDHF
jgi:REP element-mobilizing transposase RayT